MVPNSCLIAFADDLSKNCLFAFSTCFILNVNFPGLIMSGNFQNRSGLGVQQKFLYGG